MENSDAIDGNNRSRAKTSEYGLPSRDIPVDKGWAWVILAATFSIGAINIGTEKASGLFFIEFLNTFQGNVSSTALVASIMDIVACFATMVVLLVVLKKMSVRSCTCLGIIMTGFGYGISSFSKSLDVLIVIQSSLIGIGSAFYLTPLLIIIEDYFDRRKGLANALFMSGFSLGGLIMPLLYRVILDEYALRGGLVLTAGVTFNSVVFGALLRPISFYKRGNNQQSEFTLPQEEEGRPNQPLIEVKMDQQFCEASAVDTKQTTNTSEDTQPEIDASVTQNGSAFRVRANTFSTNTEILSNQTTQGQPKKLHNRLLEKVSDSFGVRYLSSSELATASSTLELHGAHSEKNIKSGSTVDNVPESRGIPSNKINTDCNLRETSFLSQPFLNVEHEQPVYRKRSSTFSTHPTSTQHKHLIRHEDRNHLKVKMPFSFAVQYLSSTELATVTSTLDLSITSAKQDKITETIPTPGSGFKKWFKSVDMGLFKDAKFILIMTILSFGGMAIRVSHIYTPAYAKDVGIEDQEVAVIVSVINISDFVGRISAGLLSDRTSLSTSQIAFLSQIAVGTILQFTEFYTKVWHLILCAVVYGSSAGMILALFPTMLIETIGKEQFRLGMALFIVALSWSFGVTLPLLGYIRDVTGSYHTTFRYISCCSYIAAALLVVKYLISRRCAKRHHDTNI